MLKITDRRNKLNLEFLESLKLFNLPGFYLDFDLIIRKIEEIFKECEPSTEQTEAIISNDLNIAHNIFQSLLEITKEDQNHYRIKSQEILLEYHRSNKLAAQKLESEKKFNELTELILINVFKKILAELKKYIKLNGINLALQKKISAIIKMLQARKYFNDVEIEKETNDLIKIDFPLNVNANNHGENEELLIESDVDSYLIDSLKRYYELPKIKKFFFLKDEDKKSNIYYQNDNKEELVYSIFKENKTINNEKFDVYRIKISKQFSYAAALIPVFYAISEKCRRSAVRFSDFKISLPKVKDTKRAFQIFMALDKMFINKNLDKLITSDEAKNIFANIIQLDNSENVRDTFTEFCSAEFDEIFMKSIEFENEKISLDLKERLKISRQGFIAHAKETFLKNDDLYSKKKESFRP